MMILVAVGMFVLGAFIGSFIFLRLMTAAYKKDPKEFISILNKNYNKDEQTDNIEFECVELEVEKHGTQIMMWFKDSGIFVSQGISIDDALGVAHERFPKFNFTFELPEDVEYNG